MSNNSSVQKLVNETFQKLWFTPTPAHDKETMTRKILNITDVVSFAELFAFCAIIEFCVSKTWPLIRDSDFNFRVNLKLLICLSPNSFRLLHVETLVMTGLNSFSKT